MNRVLIDTRRFWLALFVALGIVGLASCVTGCAAGHPRPESVGQAIVEAKGTVEKATRITTRLLHDNVITVDQAAAWDAKITEVRSHLDIADTALDFDDLTTATGQLQAMQALLDELTQYMNAHPETQP